MTTIIQVLIRIEDETPEAFKARISAAQMPDSAADLPEGAICLATIVADGLRADIKWGQADEELPADTCVVAWRPLAASSDFIEVDQAVISKALRRAQIATEYAGEMKKLYGGAHRGVPGTIHFNLADDILSKNAYGLEHLVNGMNGAAKAMFTSATGVSLPKQQGLTWKAIREWAGVSDAADEVVKAQRKVNAEVKALERVVNNIAETQAWFRKEIQQGFNRLVKEPGRWVLANDVGIGYDMSKRGSNFAKARPLLVAELALAKAQAALAVEQGVQPAEVTALAA